MKITAKTSLLLDVMNAANVITDEANFHLSADGLAFRSMDPSHIAMIDVLIPPTDFAKYEVTDGVKFALRTQEVAKILKRFDKDSEVSVTIADNHLVISDSERTFKVRVMDFDGSSSPLPKLTFTAKIETPRVDFVKVVGDIATVAEHIQLETKNNTMTTFGRGDTGEAQVVIKGTLETKADSKATYSLDYIIKMVKAVSVDMVTLEYSSKMPLKLSLGRISYFLAPRVQE